MIESQASNLAQNYVSTTRSKDRDGRTNPSDVRDTWRKRFLAKVSKYVTVFSLMCPLSSKVNGKNLGGWMDGDGWLGWSHHAWYIEHCSSDYDEVHMKMNRKIYILHKNPKWRTKMLKHSTPPPDSTTMNASERQIVCYNRSPHTVQCCCPLLLVQVEDCFTLDGYRQDDTQCAQSTQTGQEHIGIDFPRAVNNFTRSKQKVKRQHLKWKILYTHGIIQVVYQIQWQLPWCDPFHNINDVLSVLYRFRIPYHCFVLIWVCLVLLDCLVCSISVIIFQYAFVSGLNLVACPSVWHFKLFSGLLGLVFGQLSVLPRE